MISFKNGQTVLFIGDSITDCGRSRENPEELGTGYVNFIAAQLNTEIPEMNLRFLNLGISGNRVKDLKARWRKDCLEHKPDILSILIGINDVWRRYDSNDPTDAEVFYSDYREILESVKNEFPQCRIVIIEPFVLPFPEDRKEWRTDIDPKIRKIRELAVEYADVYVPMDGIFASASCRRTHKFWLIDGVHPTQAGHMLIADSWLEYVS
jgi:lysophospholipase L1-like esterase